MIDMAKVRLGDFVRYWNGMRRFTGQLVDFIDDDTRYPELMAVVTWHPGYTSIEDPEDLTLDGSIMEAMPRETYFNWLK